MNEKMIEANEIFFALIMTGITTFLIFLMRDNLNQIIDFIENSEWFLIIETFVVIMIVIISIFVVSRAIKYEAQMDNKTTEFFRESLENRKF